MLSNDKFYRIVLDHLDEGVFIVDRDKNLTYWNRGAKNLAGFDTYDVLDAINIDQVKRYVDESGKEMAGEDCPIALTLRDGINRTLETSICNHNGERIPVIIKVSPVLDTLKNIQGAVEVIINASERHEARREITKLKEAALLDPLTGAGNRRRRDITLVQRLEEFRRYGRDFGVLFFDIDHFKQINDTYGHGAGDSVLRRVSQAIANSLRPFDFLGRWGGEEFVAVVINVSEERLIAVAERIRKKVEKMQIPLSPAAVTATTISIGATMARADDTPASLIMRADELLYRSKARGRNSVTHQ